MGGFIIVVLIKYTISGHHKVFDGSAANFGPQSIHAIQPTYISVKLEAFVS